MLALNQNELDIYETGIKGVKIFSYLGKEKQKNNQKCHRRTEIPKEKNDVIKLKPEIEMQYNVSKTSKIAQSTKQNFYLKAQLKEIIIKNDLCFILFYCC